MLPPGGGSRGRGALGCPAVEPRQQLNNRQADNSPSFSSVILNQQLGLEIPWNPAVAMEKWGGLGVQAEDHEEMDDII